jgi:spore coat protein U-like protein
MKTATRLALLGGLSLIGGVAQAATTTSTFQVQLTVTAQCVINSAATLNFGSNGVINANIDQTSLIKVQCTNTTPFDIGLDAGQGAGANVTTRLMTGPSSETVQYKLYSNAGRTIIWGDTVATDTVTSAGTGAEQTFTVYGRVPPQTTSRPGAYADTVQVTVTY